MQPDKIETFLALAEFTDGGLIPCQLVCHSRAMPRPIVDDGEGIAADAVDAWVALVQALIQTFRMAAQAAGLAAFAKFRPPGADVANCLLLCLLET